MDLPPRVGNQIIDALGAAEQEAFLALAQPVVFPRRSTIMKHGRLARCLFLRRGAASILFEPPGGSPVEVGVVGPDGMLGLAAVFCVDAIEHHAITLNGCDALAIEPETLRKLADTYPDVDRAMLRYANARLIQAMKFAACHLHHQLEQRLAGWTMTMSNLLGSSEIAVTHEQLSSLLGVTRPSITVSLQILEERHAIWSKRGLIAIRDRHLLKGLSCSCYGQRGPPEPPMESVHTLRTVTKEPDHEKP